MAQEPHGRADPEPRLRVLIVDDDPTVRGVLSAQLKRRGHEATAVGTNAEALAALAAAKFDVVVADVLLPDGDGIDLLSHITANRLAARVITVTGGGRYFGPEFFGRVAMALGAVVLQKPFESDVFLSAVEGRPVPQSPLSAATEW